MKVAVEDLSTADETCVELRLELLEHTEQSVDRAARCARRALVDADDEKSAEPPLVRRRERLTVRLPAGEVSLDGRHQGRRRRVRQRAVAPEHPDARRIRKSLEWDECHDATPLSETCAARAHPLRLPSRYSRTEACREACPLPSVGCHHSPPSPPAASRPASRSRWRRATPASSRSTTRSRFAPAARARCSTSCAQRTSAP